MKKRIVLVVDDENLIRWSLYEKLTEAGYDVVEAGDGKSALELARRDGIAMMLLDYRLPDMDGLKVLDELRSIHPDCPVIMMSAYGTDAVKVEALAKGVKEFIDKPFDYDAVVSNIQKILN
ncbi:MAG: response regulator [Planctomycetaceae bacterium]|nr:response regulator [Planctomycetaceae bacterium]